MASIKLLLWKHDQKKDGTYPIAIRITQNRKTRYVFTGKYILEKQWDFALCKVKKAHPNSTRLNNFLISKLAEANKTLLDLENKDKVISSTKIKQELTNPLGGKSFNDVARVFLENLKSNKKISRYKADRVRVNHFIHFCQSDKIRFAEITEVKLRNFMTYLEFNKGLSKRSVMNNLVVIRTIYNKAIKMDIIDRKFYPFGTDKIQIKFPESEKIGLTKEEVKKVESLKDLTKQEKHARNVWLFSFYFAGVRIGDVLKIRWNRIIDGRLYYRMNKNEKLLSLKIPPKLIKILEEYQIGMENPEDFIFPDMKGVDQEDAEAVLTRTNTVTKRLNEYLDRIACKAGIDKKITMHIARHTFGNISGDEIHPLMLQKLYRHSDLKTTINYQANFIHKEADEALDSVVNF